LAAGDRDRWRYVSIVLHQAAFSDAAHANDGEVAFRSSQRGVAR